jgi:hypothetical protein
MPNFKEEDIKMSGLTYPSDLGDGITYPDIIQITIIKKNGANLKFIKDNAGKNFKADLANSALGKRLVKELNEARTKPDANGKKMEKLNATQAIEQIVSVSGQLQNVADDLIDAKPDGVSDLLQLGSAFGTSLVDTLQKSKIDPTTGKPSIEKPLATISLPMPDNLTYNEQIEWQSTDLGALGGGAKGASLNGGSVAGAGFSQLGSIISGGTGALVSSVLGAGIAGGAVLGVLGAGNSVQGTIESQVRVKSNPFKEQTFQGVPFRPFEFSWTFSPTSQREVDDIKKIIKLLRQHSRPSYDGGNQFLFKYPDTMQIEFKTYSRKSGILKANPDVLITNKYLPKLKQCICKSINTNYATAGWHSFKEGAPTSITLQLQFEEIDIVTSEDIETEDY